MRARPDAPEEEAGTRTEDAFLGGRLTLRQPRQGHRAGLEAVLIAAAAPLEPGQTIVDIGAGVGASGLCVLTRVSSARTILVEADPVLAALAAENIALNGLSDRAEVVICDVVQGGAAARTDLTGRADHALANPPFHDPTRHRISPHKKDAHAAPMASLDGWLRFAAAVLRPGGTLTLVHRADALGAVIAAGRRRFGDLRILPVHPRPGQPAHRVLIQGVRGSRASMRLLPGLVLHGAQGHAFAPEVEAVLRDGAPLALAGARTAPHLMDARKPSA